MVCRKLEKEGVMSLLFCFEPALSGDEHQATDVIAPAMRPTKPAIVQSSSYTTPITGRVVQWKWSDWHWHDVCYLTNLLAQRVTESQWGEPLLIAVAHRVAACETDFSVSSHVGSSGGVANSPLSEEVNKSGKPQGLLRTYLLPILLDWHAICRWEQGKGRKRQREERRNISFYSFGTTQFCAKNKSHPLSNWIIMNSSRLPQTHKSNSLGGFSTQKQKGRGYCPTGATHLLAAIVRIVSWSSYTHNCEITISGCKSVLECHSLNITEILSFCLSHHFPYALFVPDLWNDP